MKPNNLWKPWSLAVSTLTMLVVASASVADDWTNWRGPNRDGVSTEKNLPDDVNDVLWMKKDISCRSTPIVMNGKVYIISRTGEGEQEQERVVCMDAKTGDVVWEHRFSIFFTPIVSVRLGWTVAAGDEETGNVYVHGTQGFLFCFDGETGEVKWQKSLTEELGRITGYGGRVTSPVVDGNLVMISMLSSNWGAQGGGGCRFFAFDKHTGEIVWWNTTGIRPSNSYRCVPIVTTLNGQRVLISGGGDGNIHAFQVNTGRKVWSFPFGNGAMNPAQIIDGTRLYCAHGEEIPGRATVGRLACLELKSGTPEIVWELDGIEFKYPSPMLYDGKLYIPSRQGYLYCYDAKTGERLWRSKFGRNCTSSPVFGDGKIYVSAVEGMFQIMNAETGKRMSTRKFQPADPRFDVEVQGSAAISNGCVYFGTTEEFYCLGAHAPPQKTRTLSAAVPAAGVSGSKESPAHLQVVPAEVTLKAGESIELKANFFDANGNLIGPAKPTFSMAAMGGGAGLSPDAKRPILEGTMKGNVFTASSSGQGQAGVIVCKAGDLEAKVRVRQVPTLPYTEDFESIPPGLVPGGWTNTQLRYVTTKLDDGNTVLMKTAKIAVPFYRQWYAFAGTPDMNGYTVEADVMGEQVDSAMPNMGLTANRYILQLVGNEQELRVSAWDAIPRVSAEIKYDWKPDTWYRMKLSVEVGEDSAKVLGKVWVKGEAEPTDWTIELEDSNPNRSGSPGIYGSAQGIKPPALGTQIYYDNVSIK
ncbi:MAG: PQQ-binding-like beta-propeller repeat protein [Planctomycetota bacterium]